MDENRPATIADGESGRGSQTRRPTDHDAGQRAKPKRHGRRWIFGGLFLVVAAGLAAWGIVERNDTVTTLKKTADDVSVPKVTLISPKPGPKSRTLTLPGKTQAWYKAPIFAQVTGYVRMWYTDYGAIVHKDELLATIETPNLDQELQQARARLDVARTKYAVAKVTADRWQKLLVTHSVSQETVDVNTADAKEAAAEVQAAQFNVARYESQEAFKRVVAPFDGVVTARDTDIGNFVNAAGGNSEQRGATQELFTVSDIHEIRIYVSVPQNYSSYITPGVSATMTMPQFPNQKFPVNVLTTAKSYNEVARTVLTELTIPNPKQEIFPDAFAEVEFKLPTDPNILVIPEQSILFRSQGLQVALVDKDSKVHLQDIRLGLNLGDTVQVTEGLKPSDQLIANPSDGLLEGETVDVVHAPPQNTDMDSEPDQSSPKSPSQ